MDLIIPLTVVGAFAAVVAVVQTYRANRLNKRVVEAQGGLAKPKIRVEWFGSNKEPHVLLADFGSVGHRINSNCTEL